MLTLVTALLFTQSAFGGSFPAVGTPIGGKDSVGKMRPVSVTTTGATNTVDVGGVNYVGSGTITGTQTVEVAADGAANARVRISGAWTGTVLFEGSVDGTNFDPLYGVPSPITTHGGSPSLSAHDDGVWEVRCAGLQKVRVRGATVTGTATIWIDVSRGASYVANATVVVVSSPSAENSVTCEASGPTCLGVSGVFTGTGIDTFGYAHVSMSASSDVPSAVSGIEFQWSSDNVHWSTRGVTQLSAARVGQDHATDLSQRLHDRYFRIRYTNGAVAQTFFRLLVMTHVYPTEADTKGVDQEPQSGDDAILTKSVIAGKTTAGGTAYVDVKVNPSGALAADVTQGAASNPWIVAGTGVASAIDAGTCTSVTGSTTVLAANANRKVAVIVNAGTANVHVKLGATATTSNPPLAAGSRMVIEGPVTYTGVVDAIASSGTHTVCTYSW